MATVTLTSKGQLTIPRQLRDALGLAPGARLEDLFRDRPKVQRVMTTDDMDRAIALAVGGEDA
jgi:AbrB family looped-hinge helix DNA binding protein